MNTTVKLTEGAISLISTGQWKLTDAKPVLQVRDIRSVQMKNSSGVENKERYRIVLSDGSFHQQGMLGIQLNELIRSQQLQKDSVIQLNEYTCNEVNGRMIIIVLDLNVIVQQCETIGNPTSWSLRFGSGPPPLNNLAPMQPINQPVTTMNNSPQMFTAPVTRPNLPANSPIYPPQQGHNAGLHSYGNPISNFTNTSSMHSRPDSVTPISRPPANNYIRPAVQPAYNQNPPMYNMNRGPTAKTEAQPKIIPISALNPYQGRWTIKARVTAKTELRHYNNAKGDGKVFSFDLLDSHSGEIRTTCFNDVADQFYNQIQAGRIYYISKGSLKPKQKAFNHLNNEYEITLDKTSTIQICVEDDKSIPPQQYHFRPIAEIEGLDNNAILDVIGVVYSISPSSSVNTKNGETLRRTLELKDMSERSVKVTLWGNFCNTEGQKLQNSCDSGIFPILAVKSAKVNEFNGKSVGTLSASQLIIEPDLPEARKLREWFDNGGQNTVSVSLSNSSTIRPEVRKTISQIKDEKIGTSDKPDYITVSATIWLMRLESFCYTACPLVPGGKACNKKVTNNGDGKWRCDKCDQTVDECDYRYILQLQIQDHTGLIWVTAFQEAGVEILGVTAKELYNMKYEEQDEDRFTEIIRNAAHTKYNLLLKVKEETYNDDPRVKSTVVKATKIEYSPDTRVLLDLLTKDDLISVGPKVEQPISFNTESAPFRGVGQQGGLPLVSQTGQYGNQFSGGGQQGGFPPVSQMGQYGNQYGGLPPANQTGQYGNQYGGLPPVSQTGQYGNQYGGSRIGSNCNSCGGVGHYSSDCPSVANASSGGISSVTNASSGGRFNSMMASGGGNSGVPGECYKCHKPGHWARDCPGVNNVNTGYGGGNVAQGRYGNVSGQYVGGY